MTSPQGTGPALVAARIAQMQLRILTWFAAHRRDLPWRRTVDPYAILVSEVMLQQTQVARVAPRFEDWLHTFPTLEALATASLTDVLTHWQGLGYNTRARRLRDAAVAAVAATRPGRAAELPRSPAGLQALPGIGPYTARAVLIFAHNDALAAVDANVRRVLTHELALPIDLPPCEVQAVADAALPPGRSRDWHNALMDYGAMVLTARATGIAPRTRQSAFEGSRRQYRARLLRLLLARGPLSIDGLADALSLETAVTKELVRVLAGDGLVVFRDDRVAVA